MIKEEIDDVIKSMEVSEQSILNHFQEELQTKYKFIVHSS